VKANCAFDYKNSRGAIQCSLYRKPQISASMFGNFKSGNWNKTPVKTIAVSHHVCCIHDWVRFPVGQISLKSPTTCHRCSIVLCAL